MLPPPHWPPTTLKPHQGIHLSLVTLLLIFSHFTPTQMIQTISPYSATRTAEIMSRYRPIAPKPESPTDMVAGAESENAGGLPNGIRKSPYLRNVWAHLQARPTRTRKRGRTAAFSPQSVKRARACLQGLSPPYAVANPTAAVHGYSLVPLNCGLDTAVTTLAESVAALPNLRVASAASQAVAKGIDLNVTAEQAPEELDFLPQLQQPLKPVVISPRPVRPVGSAIIVDGITIAGDSDHPQAPLQTAAELEAEIEAETMPAIISDSNNKVRVTNAAYNEMVGQPECSWLARASGGACKRIGGDVLLHFVDSEPPMSVHVFTCRVKIEWKTEGRKYNIGAVCTAAKICCPVKDYQFLWRFEKIGSPESVLGN